MFYINFSDMDFRWLSSILSPEMAVYEYNDRLVIKLGNNKNLEIAKKDIDLEEINAENEPSFVIQELFSDLINEVHNALAISIGRAADASAAMSWSTSDSLPEKYVDPITVAEFGDSVAIDGDLTVPPSIAAIIGCQPGDNWSDVVYIKYINYLIDSEGYEETDFGGEVPNTEEEIQMNFIIEDVAENLHISEDVVYWLIDNVEELKHYRVENYYTTVSGESTVYAKRTYREYILVDIELSGKVLRYRYKTHEDGEISKPRTISVSDLDEIGGNLYITLKIGRIKILDELAAQIRSLV